MIVCSVVFIVSMLVAMSFMNVSVVWCVRVVGYCKSVGVLGVLWCESGVV